jgi:hypothetical protein
MNLALQASRHVDGELGHISFEIRRYARRSGDPPCFVVSKPTE